MSKGKTTSGHFPSGEVATTQSNAPTKTIVLPSTGGEPPKAVTTPQRGGKFTVNGVAVPIDLSMHSVANIVTLINAAQGTGAVASIDRDGSLRVDQAVGGPSSPVFGGDNATLVALGLA